MKKRFFSKWFRSCTCAGSINSRSGKVSKHPFILEPSFEHGFAFKPAGILMEFEPAKNRFTLNQGGGKFNFTKI